MPVRGFLGRGYSMGPLGAWGAEDKSGHVHLRREEFAHEEWIWSACIALCRDIPSCRGETGAWTTLSAEKTKAESRLTHQRGCKAARVKESTSGTRAFAHGQNPRDREETRFHHTSMCCHLPKNLLMLVPARTSFKYRCIAPPTCI